jgi:hypothetical protein
LYGEASPAVVTQAVTAAKAGGRPVVLTDGLTITGSGAASFEDLNVRVEGSVTISDGAIINAAYASLSFAENSSITVAGSSTSSFGTFIYSGEGEGILSTGTGKKAKYVSDPLTVAPGTATHIAVDEFKAGGDVAGHVTTLIVLKTLTVDATSPAFPDGNTPGDPRIVALGIVDFTQGNTASLGNLDFASTSAITSSTGDITVSLPASSAISVKAEKPFTIQGGETALQLGSVEGPATVTIATGSLTALTIGTIAETGKLNIAATTVNEVKLYKNKGEINFTSDLTAVTFALASPEAANTNEGTVNFAGTVASATIPAKTLTGAGKVVFGENVTFSSESNIGNDVEFNGTATIGAAAFTAGNVSFGIGKGFTFGGTSEVTIKGGKAISVGATKVLETVTDVVLTPTSGGTLTNPAPTDAEDEEAEAKARTLTVGGAALTLTSGQLKVAGILAIDGFALSLPYNTPAAAGAVAPAPFLILGDGSSLVLKPAASNGSKLVVGDSTSGINFTIAGPASAATNPPDTTLTASGEVTFTIPSASAPLISGAGSSITSNEEGSAPAYSVSKANLNVKGVNLDLSVNGSIALTADNTTARVILEGGANPGKISFSSEGGVPVTTARPPSPTIGNGTNAYAISGGVIQGEEDAATTAIVSLSGGTTSNLTITGNGSSGQAPELVAGAVLGSN